MVDHHKLIALFLLSACQLSEDPTRESVQGAACSRDGACCSLTPSADEANPLQASLGCGPSFQYRAALDVAPIFGSFCPDTIANRRILHARGLSGYPAGYCEGCLCVPPDQIFVVWVVAAGQTCPSGCRRPLPPPL